MAINAISHALCAALLLAVLGLAAQRCGDSVCLASFDFCKDNGGVCTFDRDAYPGFDPKGLGISMTIVVGFNYTIAWKGADPASPLRISWHFANTSVYNSDVRWAHDIRAPSESGTYVWSPAEVLKDFPTPYAPNMTQLEAFAYASTYDAGYVGVSQPERVGGGGKPDISDYFILQSREAERIVREQYIRGRREVMEKWTLGVGIGVGLGVPVLVAAFWVIGYKQGKTGAWNWQNHVPKA